MSVQLDYFADGVGTAGKNLSHFAREPFASAALAASEGSAGVYAQGIVDVRWRQHIACWAAKNGLGLEGDFVECGVNTGLMAMAVCKFLNIDKTDKKFYLFDTYEGIPIEQLHVSEVKLAESHNKLYYTNVYGKAKENFRPYKNTVMVKGILPATLSEVNIEKVAYLSIDLNQVFAEKAVIEALWDKLSVGAMVLIDDYGFMGHDLQHKMWNEFAVKHDKYIASLPTGQGLIIK
ncbi:TylF/MycF family methyltransferase [Rhizobium sp. XQZ8]|uniref:TylF/MycF/NovP-related O-methyltransferase n=1 Tax=Rhizobium populisoli TaxID=2859785 RepID=UPI001C678259|nr:TylF/MycF/NovP-related O-methyltransferase [Rhizobium populisoli]MBW6422499.1 TylF/MycF family methyltransferase [Rhizobium populisoli]